MRALLLAPTTLDHVAIRAALGAALGGAAVDTCHATEAAVTWLENRPCDLVGVAGAGPAVVEAIDRLRRASHTLPLLAIVDDLASRDAGLAWLAGADEVIALGSLSGATLPEGLEDVGRHERDALRRPQRVWYAGAGDGLRQQLGARLGPRLRDVGLSAEGLVGLTTQDLEALQSAALVVNAFGDPAPFVLGVRRVKRTYPALAVAVLTDPAHHDAFRRAGADECLPGQPDADRLLHAVARAQTTCRAAAELDAVRARETRLRSLLENLPEAVVLVSPEHTVLAVNLAALRLVGAQDARQMLGSGLTPWLEPEDGDPSGIAALVDSVTAGAAREGILRTRHLADPRRLHLRAVPFQRDSGGSPAALVVLRDVAGLSVGPSPADPAPSDALEAERRAHAEAHAIAMARMEELEQALLVARVDSERLAALAAELDAIRGDAVRVPALESDLAASRAELARLQALEADMQAAAARITELEAALDASREYARVATEDLTAMHAAVTDLRTREASAASSALEMRDARDILRGRVVELEGAVASFEYERNALEASRAIAAVTQPPDAAMPDDEPPSTQAASPLAHGWLLEHVAGVGVLVVDRDGHIVEANQAAARLCGFESPDRLRAAGRLPEPLAAMAGEDLSVASRFELCLQSGHEAAPAWIAGARLPVSSTDDLVTWWLAATSGGHTAPMPLREDSETFTSVLHMATAECSALVSSVSHPRGPRSIESMRDAEFADGRALGRAQVMLSQLNTLGRRRVTRPTTVDLSAQLTELAPMLERLAGDDLEWRCTLPPSGVHACVASADLERCLTALVASARDALPLGGRLSLTLDAGRDAVVAADGVMRPDVVCLVEAQGYGLTPIDVPAAARDLARGIGATLTVDTTDSLTAAVQLRLPRAFVITHAA